MSEENVEIVRRYYDAWNAGGLDAARAFWTQTDSTAFSSLALSPPANGRSLDSPNPLKGGST
jgi:hypothetical protein